MDEKRNRELLASILTGQTFFGVPVREPYASEMQFFHSSPSVAGMATEDNRIIINPFAKRSPQEMQAVAENEALRVLMRTNQAPRPQFDLTPNQQKVFENYSPNLQDQRETVAARIFSNDPSVSEPSPEQQAYVQMLRDYLTSRR